MIRLSVGGHQEKACVLSHLFLMIEVFDQAFCCIKGVYLALLGNQLRSVTVIHNGHLAIGAFICAIGYRAFLDAA
jgi:hypothetical protein